MDFGSVLIGMLVLVLCAVPFFIDYRNRRKKKNIFLLNLNSIAEQQNCVISQAEFCNDFVLGIDENKNFIFFYKQKKEESIAQYVDLGKIKACQTVKKTRSIKRNNDNIVITEKVNLSFMPATNGNGEMKFELYDEDINLQLSGELQVADKWAKQINNRLNNKN